MRFGVDTNTLISALIKPDSIPARAINLAFEKGNVLFSLETRAEFLQVLSRTKFDKYLPPDTRMENALVLLNQSETIEVLYQEELTCRDESDKKFLHLALQDNINMID